MRDVDSSFRFPITKEMMMSLTDAIFAVSITLMVLELDVPEFQAIHSDADVITAILGMAPTVYGYARTFISMGVAWFFIRWMYGLLERIDFAEFLLTLLYLFFSTLWPLCGFLYYTYGGDWLTGEWAINVTTASIQLFFALVGLAMWWYAASDRRLLSRGVTDWQTKVLYAEVIGLIALFGIALLLLFTLPPLMPWFILIFWNGAILVNLIWQDTIFSVEPKDKKVWLYQVIAMKKS